MITRNHLRSGTALRYSWRNIAYSTTCSTVVFLLVHFPFVPLIKIPVAVVAVLGTALAIILGFKNSSAYDRWWEARKIWGGVVNESRTLARQTLNRVDAAAGRPGAEEVLRGMVRTQMAWANALRLQLRRITDPEAWTRTVSVHLTQEQVAGLQGKVNKVTHLGMAQGASLEYLRGSGAIDGFQFLQLDGTLSRLTDLQGMAERIRSTPLPRPYDYYTKTFLYVFILMFPFGVINSFLNVGSVWAVIPVTVVVSWIFYQLYIFGKVMSNPFENWHTDVAMDAICTTIEIDLREVLGDTLVPTPLEPKDGVLM